MKKRKKNFVPSKEQIDYYTEKEDYKFASVEDTRIARYVFAYFRRNQDKGFPIYIRIGKHHYRRFDFCTMSERASYFAMLDKQWKSQYFDTLLPIKKAMSQEEIKNLHIGNLYADLERILNNENK